MATAETSSPTDAPTADAPADAPVALTQQPWHFHPVVDLVSYGFSWVFVLLPMAFLGNAHRVDYPWIYLLVLAATDVHRHFGYPYVYFDGQVFWRHPIRFVLFPGLMFALFITAPYFGGAYGSGGWVSRGVDTTVGWVLVMVAASVVLTQVLTRDIEGRRPTWATTGEAIGAGVGGALVFAIVGLGGALATYAGLVAGSLAFELRSAARGEAKARPGYPFVTLVVGVAALAVAEALLVSPSRAIPYAQVLAIAAVFAGLWNIWHVYMQKYGILRMYSAKAGTRERTPGWVDRFLVWGWLPLYLAYLGPIYDDELFRLFRRGEATLRPVFEVIEQVSAYVLWPSIGLVLFAIGAFVYWEWRTSRLTNRPRILMAIGTTLLASSFLLVHPLKAYLAYAFSHAVEYMVFVWAFQRKRYGAPLSHRPLLERLLKHPAIFYGVFILGLGAFFLWAKYWGGSMLVPEATRVEFADIYAYKWIAQWTVFQSMVHFYFDGFLWKMRLPTVRAHL